MLILAACDLSGITISFNEDEDKDEPVEEATTELDEENEEIDEAEDEDETNEDTNGTSDENEVSTDDVASILQQSFEAMSELTSIHMSAHGNIYEKINGEDVKEEKVVDMTMFLEEPYGKHFAIEIESNVAETIVSEVYEASDFHYIHSSVHDVDWGVIPNPSGSQPPPRFIEEATIEEHLVYSDLFEIVEESNEYWLSFTGTREQAMSSVYGGAIELLDFASPQSITEIMQDLEEVASTYVIIIDKDTYYVKGYEIYYEAKIPEDLGEYHAEMKQIVILDSHNDLSEFIVPQEVIDEAEPM